MVKKAPTGPRVRKGTWRQRRVQAKREVGKRQRLAGGFRLVWQCLCLFKKHWLPLGGILIIYTLLNVLFTSGLSDIGQKFQTIRDKLSAIGDSQTPISDTLSNYSLLFSSPGADKSEAGLVLGGALFIFISLVIIWALRQLLANKPITIRQAFYNSTGQLVQFLAVLAVLIIELLPMAIGIALLTNILSESAEAWGVFIFGTLCVALSVASLYLVLGSLFALFVVTLPGMEPLASLRSANNLVRFRRLEVLRRLVFLPLFSLLAIGIVVIPLMLYLPALVTPVFFVLTIVAVLFIFSYMYNLYRSLLE